jgi:hypothetical protein
MAFLGVIPKSYLDYNKWRVAHAQAANLRHGHAGAKACKHQRRITTAILWSAHFGDSHSVFKLLIFDNNSLGHTSL